MAEAAAKAYAAPLLVRTIGPTSQREQEPLTGLPFHVGHLSCNQNFEIGHSEQLREPGKPFSPGTFVTKPLPRPASFGVPQRRTPTPTEGPQRCAGPSEATETAGVFVVLRGLGDGAPSKDRTCDLGFRKTSGSEPGLRYRTAKPLRFLAARSARSLVLFARCPAIAQEHDGGAQIVRGHVRVALRGRHLGVPREPLHGGR